MTLGPLALILAGVWLAVPVDSVAGVVALAEQDLPGCPLVGWPADQEVGRNVQRLAFIIGEGQHGRPGG